MGKVKQRVSAKRFVEDYRAGKTDDELMEEYHLTRTSLPKVLARLVKQNLLDSADIRSRGAFQETVLLEPPVSRADRGSEQTLESPVAGSGPSPENQVEKPKDKALECPQCGAQVTLTMLLCPECGHMLSGQERWERVEPPKRFIDRVPPKVLGTIIALPLAIALIFVFKNVIIPMTNVTIEKRANEMRRHGAAHRSTHPRKTHKVRQRSEVPAKLTDRVKELIENGVFSEAASDYTLFTTGYRWGDLSEDERIGQMEGLRSEMLRTWSKFQFAVVEPGGKLVGRATESSVSLLEE